MKKTIILSTLFLLTGWFGYSQGNSLPTSGKFEKAMLTNLAVLDTARTPGTLISLANNFERIATAEKTEWLPYYYSAYCYTMLALNTPDLNQIDPLADKAETSLQKAEALNANNSEISCLHAMIIASRVLVDPMNRWQTMSIDIESYLSKSRLEDPANPRPYLLEANTKLKTPESMGGGRAAAKPIIEEAVKRYKAFKPETPIYPNWGKQNAEGLLKAVGG